MKKGKVFIKSLGLTFSAVIGLLLSGLAMANPNAAESFTIEFNNSEHGQFSELNKKRINQLTKQTLIDMQPLLPELKSNIHFTIKLMDRDLSMVNGVTGRADKKDAVEISISSKHQGGIAKAIEDGFVGTLIHELHHTVRGWTIYNNEFDQGIDIAAVNEGLADVFAESIIGKPMNSLSKNEDFGSWVEEIKALPKNANYGQWMFMHPDGRIAVGYRTGEFIVKQAMMKSGKTIHQLSKLTVAEIYKLAGL